MTTNGPDPRPPVVVIVGPTGVGKTAATIDLARALNGEIVGADSVQIFRHMDIGSAKPTPAERAAAPHHLVDVADPDEPWDAARYARVARGVIADIHGRGRAPLVAGGAGLYIRALLEGIFPAGGTDPEVRRRLRDEAAARGAPALHRRLAETDPEAATRIHPNDAFRIVRALEVLEVTGRHLSTHQADHDFGDAPYRLFRIGLYREREELYERIERRVDAMLAEGLLEEVRGLLARGYGPELKPMGAIGYRHMVDFLAGRVDWAETVRLLKRDTRRYAKRQLAWFRAEADTRWTTPESMGALLPELKNFLRRDGG
ncbi:MAG: tRNA (adenosine(37)-N6)-dimethylallyltransferase MiaA [Desulfococcaceae bacterium]